MRPCGIDAEVSQQQPELGARDEVVVVKGSVLAPRGGGVLGIGEGADVATVVALEEAVRLLAPHLAERAQHAAVALGERDVAVDALQSSYSIT